jgi:hypothetical protein
MDKKPKRIPVVRSDNLSLPKLPEALQANMVAVIRALQRKPRTNG